jgi:hypothetical protein
VDTDSLSFAILPHSVSRWNGTSSEFVLRRRFVPAIYIAQSALLSTWRFPSHLYKENITYPGRAEACRGWRRTYPRFTAFNDVFSILSDVWLDITRKYWADSLRTKLAWFAL